MLLEETIRKIEPQCQIWRQKASQRLSQLAMPHWALGRLMDLAVDLCGMTQSINPKTDRKKIVVFCGDHGVACEGVSKYPQEVTMQMMHNFLAGGAGINALSKLNGIDLRIVDIGVCCKKEVFDNAGIISKKISHGTKNMAKEPAMTRDQAIRAIETGIEIATSLADETDVFGAGEMGIANTTPSSAIVSVATGSNPLVVTGKGTGIEEIDLEHKANTIEKAILLNNPDPKDGIDVLSKVGGFEIGGIAGLILGAAFNKKPVVVDGFISTASAIIARLLCPLCADYMILSHKSAEKGHKTAYEFLGKEPLLDLGMRLGEGAGAALAMNLVDASARILTDIATFDDAKVAKADK